MKPAKKEVVSMTNRRDLNYYRSLNYRVELFFESEEKCWYAELPELPGCLAHGATKEEALVNATKAKDAWLEVSFESGRDIPEPRPEIEYSGRFLLRVPKSLHGKLANEAEREGTSINRLAIQILSEELERRQTMRTVADSIKVSFSNAVRESARTFASSSLLPQIRRIGVENWASEIHVLQAQEPSLDLIWIAEEDEPSTLRKYSIQHSPFFWKGFGAFALPRQIPTGLEKSEEEKA
jgi:predicted RNase H-like HicB family nuclease